MKFITIFESTSQRKYEICNPSRQCLGQRRFESAAALDAAVAAWTADRNQRQCGTTWRFTTTDART